VLVEVEFTERAGGRFRLGDARQVASQGSWQLYREVV
jgi:hypothetical protein